MWLFRSHTGCSDPVHMQSSVIVGALSIFYNDIFDSTTNGLLMITSISSFFLAYENLLLSCFYHQNL